MIKKVLLLSFICICVFANEIELSGTVISDNEKVITSRNIGFIKDVYVSEGSFVKKGQLLYEIDSSSIDSKKNEALLNLQIQKNKLNNIKINYQRYLRLYKQDLVPKFDLEQLELKMLNIKNMILIANSKLDEVKHQYKYLQIKAPNNGLIIKKYIKAGEMAMPMAPAIILSDLSNLKIKTDISQKYLNDIKLGQKVSIFISSINLETKGKIDAIIPNMNENTHSFILKISFDKKNKIIYPGMYSKLLINKNIQVDKNEQ